MTCLSQHQTLGNNGAQIKRQIQKQLIMLFGREKIGNPIQCLGRTIGVQGRHHQMSRPGKLQGRSQRLPIANFPHHDHVGRRS